MGPVAQISGLGVAGLTRTATGSAEALALQAVDHALTDAGLAPAEVDGLLISRSGTSTEPGLSLHAHSGLPDLRFLQVVDCEGTSAIQMAHTASLAVTAGVARHVVCVFGDAPLNAGVTGREAFTKAKSVSGVAALRYSAGAYGGSANYGLSMARYMHEFGVGERDVGAVAVSTRAWARLNPDAVMRKPMTIEDYLASRFIVRPLRLFDCAVPVNGAIAFVVSATDHRAASTAVPVYIHGIGQAHGQAGNCFNAWRRSHVRLAGDTAFAMAGAQRSDVDVCEFYDAFSIMTLLALEDHGFCAPGEAAALAASGALAPGGRLPTNTGGGHLSGCYLQGMTPLAEAVWQARGQAGERQCARHRLVMVTNEGGWFDHHACLLLSPDRRLD